MLSLKQNRKFRKILLKIFIKPSYKNSDLSKWYFYPPENLFVIYIKSYSDAPNYSDELTSHFDKFKIILVNRNVRKGMISLEEFQSFLKGHKKISYIMNTASMKLKNYYCLSYAGNGKATFKKLHKKWTDPKNKVVKRMSMLKKKP